jgi:DNA-binding transcriptional MerR regulator
MGMGNELWTLDELKGRVRDALAFGYVPGPSGRVRAVPDRRTIRYYTTLGLIDRAAAMRGRTALYSQRHLLQLVAVKRLQADGLSLSQVQQRLAGLSDDALTAIAKLPDPDAKAFRDRRESFWEDAPADVSETTPAKGPAATWRPRGMEAPHLQTLTSLSLAEGASLLLGSGVRLAADDLREIVEAAGPLLQILQSKGIIA